MNLARLFSYTKLVESELERERRDHAQTCQILDQERQRFVDAMLISAGKRPVYAIPEPPKQKPLASAIGATQARARDAELHRRTLEAQGDAPTPIRLPSAIGSTQARARDSQLQKQIASDEEIKKVAISVTNGNAA